MKDGKWPYPEVWTGLMMMIVINVSIFLHLSLLAQSLAAGERGVWGTFPCVIFIKHKKNNFIICRVSHIIWATSLNLKTDVKITVF